MPCTRPLRGYRSKDLNNSGKRSIVFNQNEGCPDLPPVDLNCGQCTYCRVEKSRKWAVRCMHEASLYDANSFITLTYAPEHLPPHNSLNHRDFQLFMKRLRKQLAPRTIRYFMCGEYGEKYSRAHYHACIFNYDFPDKKLVKQEGENQYYDSPELTDLWEKGKTQVGNLTFKSAAYVARYITKKITGPDAWQAYQNIDLSTGEILAERTPEYAQPSRGPGIGKGFYLKHKGDLYPSDFIIVNGVKQKIPKFYDKIFEHEHPDEHEYVVEKRKILTQTKAKVPHERLMTIEEIQDLKLVQLKRGYEK
nr:MAG: replication initiator protein [Microvirus sp.]